MTGLDERDDYDGGQEQTAPVWAVFGDLMAGLLGAFVLVLVGVLVVQMDLVTSLQTEVAKRQAEEQRRMTLEKALAIPLQTGRVTLNNGRIGISGNVLFPLGSDQLRPEGRQLLKSLVPPLKLYLTERDDMLTADCILTDDVTVPATGDATTTVYLAGCFNPDKLVVKDEYTMTEADKSALRMNGIAVLPVTEM